MIHPSRARRPSFFGAAEFHSRWAPRGRRVRRQGEPAGAARGVAPSDGRHLHQGAAPARGAGYTPHPWRIRTGIARLAGPLSTTPACWNPRVTPQSRIPTSRSATSRIPLLPELTAKLVRTVLKLGCRRSGLKLTLWKTEKRRGPQHAALHL